MRLTALEEPIEHEDDEGDEGQEGQEAEMRDGAGPVPEQIGMPALDEGHGELGGEELELREHDQGDGDAGRRRALPEELGAGGEAEAAALDDLDVVVGKADGAEGERGEDGDPDEGIGGVGPEHGGQQDGDDDEDAAHGGRARLLLVRLGPVFADVLADLELTQLLNDVGPDEQGDQQRGERGEGGAEREIAEDPEGVKEREQLFVEQPVEQEDSGQCERRFSLILQGCGVRAGNGHGAGDKSGASGLGGVGVVDAEATEG